VQVHDFNSEVFGVIGEGKVMVPTIPVYLFSSSFASPVNVVFRVQVIVSVYLLMPRSLRCKIDSGFLTKTPPIACAWLRSRG